MVLIDFRRHDGGGNGHDGPATNVVDGSVTIDGGIGLNQDLSFGGCFEKSGKFRDIMKIK